MALVSVIIPNFNRAVYVARAIFSALIQDYPQKEIIVVDDGSTDLSPFAYQMFKGKIKVFFHGENKGSSCARNTGILASKGDYISFLDSDDYWLPGKLSLQIRRMETGSQWVSQTQEYWIRRGRFVNPNRPNIKRGGDLFSLSLKRCYMSPSCVMLRREVLEKVGLFDEDLKAAEDYELWIRVSSLYPIALLQEHLAVREMGKRFHLSQRKEGIEFWRILGLVRILRRWPLDPERKREALSELTRKLLIYRKGAQKRGRGLTLRLVDSMVTVLKRQLGGFGDGEI
ncbi:MAG: glycosyltransferase family 2 protein [Desulfatiglandales bacterium]